MGCAVVSQMQKTEKTMAELEIDQNVKFEWDKITEAGAELEPLSGPGCNPKPFKCIHPPYLTGGRLDPTHVRRVRHQGRAPNRMHVSFIVRAVYLCWNSLP